MAEHSVLQLGLIWIFLNNVSPCQEFQAARCMQLKFSPFLLVFVITVSPVSAYRKEGGVRLVLSFLAMELVKKLERQREGWSAELGRDGCGCGSARGSTPAWLVHSESV